MQHLKYCSGSRREQACLFRLRQTKNKIQTQKDSLDLNIRAVFSAFNIKLVPSMRNGQARSLRMTRLRLSPQFINTSSVAQARHLPLKLRKGKARLRRFRCGANIVLHPREARAFLFRQHFPVGTPQLPYRCRLDPSLKKRETFLFPPVFRYRAPAINV